MRVRHLPPHDDRPVLVDDTCYLLPVRDEAVARQAVRRLESPEGRAFLEVHTFGGAKRVINRRVLNALGLDD